MDYNKKKGSRMDYSAKGSPVAALKGGLHKTGQYAYVCKNMKNKKK